MYTDTGLFNEDLSIDKRSRSRCCRSNFVKFLVADENFPFSEEILPAVRQIKEIQILQKSLCSKSFLVLLLKGLVLSKRKILFAGLIFCYFLSFLQIQPQLS